MNLSKVIGVLLLSCMASSSFAQTKAPTPQTPPATAQPAPPPAAAPGARPVQISLSPEDDLISKYYKATPADRSKIAQPADIAKAWASIIKKCDAQVEACVNITKMKEALCEPQNPPVDSLKVFNGIIVALLDDEMALEFAKNLKACSNVPTYEKLTATMLLLEETQKKNWAKTKYFVLQNIPVDFRKPPDNFEKSMQLLLNAIGIALDDSKGKTVDVATVFVLANHALTWGSTGDMSKVSSATLNQWAGQCFMILPAFGRGKQLAEYFNARPKVRDLLSTPVRIELSDILCTYYNETGQFAACRKEIAYVKSLSGKDSSYMPSFAEALNTYFEGNIEAGISKMDMIRADAEKNNKKYSLPWIYSITAVMQTHAGKYNEALASLDKHDRTAGDTGMKPWHRFYSPSLKAVILMMTKQDAKARDQFLALRGQIVRVMRGVPTDILAWTDLHLLTVSALLKDKAGVATYHKKLQEDVAKLPSFKFLELIGNAVAKASAGTYTPADIEPARKLLGAKYPDLQRFESLIARIQQK